MAVKMAPAYKTGYSEKEVKMGKKRGEMTKKIPSQFPSPSPNASQKLQTGFPSPVKESRIKTRNALIMRTRRNERNGRRPRNLT